MSNRFLRICPRFIVNDLQLALSFYKKLGFETVHNDGNFAMIKGNDVDLHINYDPDSTPSHHVWWVEVSDIEDLYQRCLGLNDYNLCCSGSLATQPWGFKEFNIRDPFGNLILFAEATK